MTAPVPPPDRSLPVPPPGEHGGDGVTIARWLGIDPGQILDLSASLNPVAPDLAPVVSRHLGAIGRYGDPRALEALLGALLDTDPDQVVLTNGGSEAIALCAGLLRHGRVDEPEFSLYRRHLVVDPDAGRWRSNPHSPSGRLAGPAESAAVWDEAYWPLATGTWTRSDHRHGAIVLGSLTKLLSAPGLRAGYVVAPDVDTARQIRALRPEWSVGALTLDVMADVLPDLDLGATASAVRAARDALAGVLRAHALRVEVADAPWVLVHDAADLRAQLANHGIVVRSCDSFGLTHTVRIGVPGAHGLDRLARALDALPATRPPSLPSEDS